MASLELIKDNYGKIGYRDTYTHKTIITPQFDEGASYFGTDSYHKHPYASVLLNTLCGIINESGEIVVPIEYEEAYYLLEDLFAVRKKIGENNWKFGVINLKGNCVIPFEYELIENSDSFIKCYQNASSKRINEYGCGGRIMDYDGRIYKYENRTNLLWMNAKGETIYEGNAIGSAFNVLIIEGNGKLGAIDTEGATVLDSKYDEIHCPCFNRFIVRQNISTKEWNFGVIDEKQNLLIDYCYKYIESENGSFYQCWEEAECDHLSDNNYKYSNKNGVKWLNNKGEIILAGEAEILSDEFLRVKNNEKQGVYNQEGKRIVNFMYDKISEVEGKLAVVKDGKVGILGKSGEIVIDTSYDRIECVHITDRLYGGYSDPITYGKYSSEYPFDTSVEKSKFYRRELKKGWRLISGRFFFEADTVFILEKESYSELFTLSEGILPNSKFESISALTNISFAVRNEGKWGVYRADIKQILIPCEYDRIIFEGNHTVLLSRDGLWGAKTLVLDSFILFEELFDVNIPIEFLEIQTLDSMETLFSVKCAQTDYKNDKYYDYTIVDRFGKEVYQMPHMHGEAHFKFYSIERVLSFNGEKYGFINMRGYTSIPFKYDMIEEREDGRFDVCINNAWGVLDISGKEIVQIKYSERIPAFFDKIIVKDSISNCMGVIDGNGNEYLPTIYEHLMFSDNDKEEPKVIYFGFKGYESNDEPNFFSDKISCAIWGCLNRKGECIIDARYDCFKIQDGFILGGRNGRMLGSGQQGYGYYEDEYGGVYDLFDFYGNLIIGGFTSFYYNQNQELFVFQFGGNWKIEYDDHDEWGNHYSPYYSYYFEKGNSRWLVLDKELRSIVKDKNGKRHQFPKGFLGTITPKKENEKTINYWNMPLELFSINDPVFVDNLMICGDDNHEWAIRISDGASTMRHDRIHVISNDLFFFLDICEMGSRIGVAKLAKGKESDEEIALIDPLSEGICVVTDPVGGFVFGVHEIDKDSCSVKLYNINNPSDKPIVAIEEIDKSKLMDMIAKGYFLISLDTEVEGYSSIVLPKLDIFDQGFQTIVSQKETGKLYSKFEKKYWFTGDHHLSEPSDDDYNHEYGGGYDDSDYMRDNWFAMTDGMYGDMPEGFDGDFDFLGY